MARTTDRVYLDELNLNICPKVMERMLLQRNPEALAVQHASLTRRYFLQLGTAGPAALGTSELWAKQVSDEVLANPALSAAVNEPPPEKWGQDLPDGKLPSVMRVDPKTGQPFAWPIPNTIVPWAALAKVAASGKYEFRCRTVDANGIALAKRNTRKPLSPAFHRGKPPPTGSRGSSHHGNKGR